MTTPKEKPILFSGPMVRAILEGRKTQTRRVIRPQPHSGRYGDGRLIGQVAGSLSGGDYCVFTHGQRSIPLTRDCFYQIVHYCPYGQPGTVLWVRETWQTAAAMNVCHAADDYYIYRATDPDWETTEGWKWRPSIYMPREAARLFLEVRSVRVERVQNISTADIWAEGVDNGASNPKMGARHDAMQRMAFERLWDSINAKRGHSWASNPWVWVIDFERVAA